MPVRRDGKLKRREGETSPMMEKLDVVEVVAVREPRRLDSRSVTFGLMEVVGGIQRAVLEPVPAPRRCCRKGDATVDDTD